MVLHIEKPPHLPGEIIQIVNTQTGAVATGNTQIPYDDTIPQNTEGNEYMTLAITPISSTNILIIEAILNLAHTSNNDFMLAALFQDDVADALAAIHFCRDGFGNAPCEGVLKHSMVAGITDEIIFKVRAGCNVAGTTTFNGQSGGRIFGGRMASSMTIMEVKQ